MATVWAMARGGGARKERRKTSGVANRWYKCASTRGPGSSTFLHGCRADHRMMTPIPRWVAGIGLAVWFAGVAFLTLTPGEYTPPLTLSSFLCVACGWRHVADILLNWMLFLPGGFLAARFLSGGRAIAAAILTTVLIETLQIAIPGRDPASQDLIFNSLGALSGVRLAHLGLSQRERSILGWLVVAVWLAPAALLTPLTSTAALYGQWTPRFPGLGTYDGQVLSSRVGEVPVTSSRSDFSTEIDEAILRREPIEIVFVVARPPAELAPIFQVYDSLRKEIVMIGAIHEDLVVRGKNPSRVLRLDQPDVRWTGGLAHVEPGDTVRLTLERSHGSVCATINERTQCGLGPRASDGWGFLLNLEGVPGSMHALISVLWAAGLGLILGTTWSGRARAELSFFALAALGLIVAALSPDVSPDVPGSLVLLVCAVAASRAKVAFATSNRAPQPTDR